MAQARVGMEENASSFDSALLKTSRKELNQAKKAAEEAAKAYNDAIKAGNDKVIADTKKALDDALEKERQAKLANIKLEDQAAEKRRADLKQDLKTVGENFATVLKSATNDVRTNIESIMTSFVNQQESMAYGLRGTATDLTSVTQAFTKALGSTGVVKQEAVYNKLSSLITAGIVFNTEQRAYLGALAEDLGMIFDPTEGTLTRLINLQRQDLSDERMAIEYSLKEFLNQNYQTSQYIKNGFADVSSALIEAQSIMSAASSMQFEATVQKWLGSMSSAGASSTMVNALATALGQLGSNDVSVTSSSLWPLLTMAASNQGLSIADLLGGGLNSKNTNSLLAGVAQVASSVYGGYSGISRTSLANILGFSSLSDLKALAQVGDVSGSTLGTNIATLLQDMDSYLYKQTKLENSIANFMYQVATDVASDGTNYQRYKITAAVSDLVGSLASGTNTTIGKIISAAATVGPFAAMIPGIISGFQGLSNAWTSSGSATAIYNALANGQLAGTNQFGVSGLITGLTKNSGTNTSGSMIYLNTNSSDIGQGLRSSALEMASTTYGATEEEKSLNDVYNLLAGFKDTSFGTYAKIVESDNTVTIGNDLSFVQDMIAFSAFNIQNIYALLVEYLKPENVGQQAVYNLDNVQWSSPFDWYSSAGAVNLKG